MKFKLSKKVKDKWVKALRSGKYKQGQKYLLKNNTFCCLGVACEINIATPKANNATVFDNFLPIDVQNKLISFNDGNKSFNWIASYIERYL